MLALAELHRARGATEDLPDHRPAPGVRLALAILFELGRAKDRAPYEGFWRVLRDPFPRGYSDTMRGIQRKQEAGLYLLRITRDVGAPEHGPFQEKISELVLGPPKYRLRPGSAFGQGETPAASRDEANLPVDEPRGPAER